MPSFLITGVARGLGWAFLDQLSSDPSNTVIGIVRNKTATQTRVSQELNNRPNVHIIEAEITDYHALENATAEVSATTGGTLDYLIANAAYIPEDTAFDGLEDLGADPTAMSIQFRKLMDTNVLANIHLYNLFLPLILKGDAKKVVAISSMTADIDLVKDHDLADFAPYSASKAAMNLITAKFSAEYKERGVLFLSVCPGIVDTGYFKEPTPEQLEAMQKMMIKCAGFAPKFKGPDTPLNAAKAVLSVLKNCSVESGHGGAFLSHYGNKTWL